MTLEPKGTQVPVKKGTHFSASLRGVWAKLFYFTLNVVGAGIGLLGVLAGNGDLKGVGISRSAPRTTVLAGVSGT